MSDERRGPPVRNQKTPEIHAGTRFESLAPLVSLREAQMRLQALDQSLSLAKRTELSDLFRATTQVPLRFMERIVLLGRHDPAAATILVLMLRKRFRKEQMQISGFQRTVLEFIEQEWFPSIKSILERHEEEVLEMGDEDELTDPDMNIPAPPEKT